MEKEKCIIVDIDGTLANIEHRRIHLSQKNDWKLFNEKMPFDSVNVWCKTIIDQFKSEYKIILITGREALYEEVTCNWLRNNSIHYDAIFFRPEKDYREDSVVKKEIFINHLRDRFIPLFIVDDRLQVVKMWRGLGLVCLQCDWGDF